MLTNPSDAMLDIYSVDVPLFNTSFAITEQLIESSSLLIEFQRVSSPRLTRLSGLIAMFSTYCYQNRIQTVCN